MAKYAYDAWGRVVYSTGTMAAINPIRYRGYYYDAELGMYYLGERYYDPQVKPFINADTPELLDVDDSFLGANLFTYCLNDPINRTDTNGDLSLPNWAKVTIGAVATIAAVGITVATGGAATPILVGVATSTLSGAAVGYVTGGKQGAIDGAASGFMWGGVGALASSAVSAVKTVRSFNKTVDTYSNLRKQYAGTGKEVHHIVEKRLVRPTSTSPSKMLSVALNKNVHRQYTNAWISAIPYGTTSASKYRLWTASNKVYRGNRVLKMAARRTILRR